MKILFLNPTGVLGGAERSLLDAWAGLRQLRPQWEYELIAAEDGPLVRQAARLGVPCFVLALPSAWSAAGDYALSGRAGQKWMRAIALGGQAAWGAPLLWGYLRQLRLLVRQRRPDLVHSNGIKFHLLSAIGLAPDYPLIWHVRDFLSLRPLLRRMVRWVPPPAVVVANSQATAADLRRVMPRRSPEVIYNGIDTAYFVPATATVDGSWLDQAAGLPPLSGPERPVRIGLVATYARWKGHEVFIRAAAAAVGLVRPLLLRFYLIGGPIYHTAGSQYTPEELYDLIHHCGLDNCCGLVPFQDDPLRAYQSLDIVVHASTRPEPFGRTIVEAMACGKAVIVSAAGGAAELVQHGVDGWTICPGSVTELAQALARLAADAELRRRLGAAARRSAVERFDIQQHAARLVELYERMLCERLARRPH